MATLNGIVGILGGVVNVEINKTFQLYPMLVVDYVLDQSKQPSSFGYESSDETIATVGANTGVITGIALGGAQITILYTEPSTGEVYKDIIDVFVRPEGWDPTPTPPPVDPDLATAENILKDKIAFDEEGNQMIGTAEVYVENNTLYMPEGLVALN